MQITGAFLATHAEIVDNKLNVTGGVLDWIAVPRSGQFNAQQHVLTALVYLVVLMQAGPDDERQGYQLKIELIDGTAAIALRDENITLGAHSGENRFLVVDLYLAAERTGRVSILTTIGGETKAVPIELRVD